MKKATVWHDQISKFLIDLNLHCGERKFIEEVVADLVYN